MRDHTWNYRLIKYGESVRLAEVFYNGNGEPIFCTEEPIELEGYDALQELNGDEYSERRAVENLKTTLQMMLEDIENNPKVLDLETDFIGKLPEDVTTIEPLTWEDLLDDY